VRGNNRRKRDERVAEKKEEDDTARAVIGFPLHQHIKSFLFSWRKNYIT